jgi:hypothetical protein
MRDHGGHRRIVTVGLARLDRDTFGKVARTDARGIEQLYAREHLLDQRQRDAELRGDFAKVGAQITGLVDQRDQLARDDRLDPAEAFPDLREQMVVERALMFGEAVEIDPFAVARQPDRIARDVTASNALPPTKAGCVYAVSQSTCVPSPVGVRAIVPPLWSIAGTARTIR